MRRNLDSGMDAARGRTTNHERHLAATEILVTLHLAGDVGHLFETRRNQTG